MNDFSELPDTEETPFHPEVILEDLQISIPEKPIGLTEDLFYTNTMFIAVLRDVCELFNLSFKADEFMRSLRLLPTDAINKRLMTVLWIANFYGCTIKEAKAMIVKYKNTFGGDIIGAMTNLKVNHPQDRLVEPGSTVT